MKKALLFSITIAIFAMLVFIPMKEAEASYFVFKSTSNNNSSFTFKTTAQSNYSNYFRFLNRDNSTNQPTTDKERTETQPDQNTNPEQNTSPEPSAQQPPKTEVPERTQPAQPETGYSQLSGYEQRVVELVNVERSKAGLKPLQADGELSKVAKLKSEDMRDNNYFSHTSPTYGSPFSMMRAEGISYRTAGENIAAGQDTPDEVVNAWMNSSGHRANILNESYTHIGVGVASGGRYGTYWTQMFVGR